MQTTVEAKDFVKNFPFPNIRGRQSFVLNEIWNAYASGYKHILLEAPTGFGKSPVAVATALTLGSSYICTATTDLQTQYARDFPFIKMAKGKGNFICAVKEDFMVNGIYRCGLCVSNNVNECDHTTAQYGPCAYNEDFEGSRCKYRTFLRHYQIRNKGTKGEEVIIDDDIRNYYETESKSSTNYVEAL
jgi:ATP-dependent DNA helicase DinG